MTDAIKKTIYIFDASQKRGLAGIMLLNLIGAFFELIGVSAILPLVNVALDPDAIRENAIYSSVAETFHLESTASFVVFMSVVLIVIFLVKNIFMMYRFAVQASYDYKNRRIVSTRLMRCYLYQDYLFHTMHNMADLQRNVGSDVTTFFQAVSSFISMSVELLTIVFLFVFMMVVDATTTLMMAVVMGLLFFLLYGVYRKYQVRAGEQAREMSGVLSKWLLQAFGGIKEVKVMNREDFFYDHYDRAYEENNRANRRFNLLTTFPKYIVEAACVCGLLTVVCIRTLMGVDIATFVASLSAFAVAAIRILPSFNRISEYVGKIMFAKAATDNIYDDLKEAEHLKETIQQADVSAGAKNKVPFTSQVAVEEITFAYPETDKLIFDKASVTIRKNKSVAFVGESGAGKTTLADIILGLLTPSAGRVTVDGADIREHMDAWHRTIGYIPQTIYLMDDTIRNNIIFGAPGMPDESRIRNALQMAQLEDFVVSLADGLETMVGDRGVRLSGGQRQRLGIARALYHEPDILVLDEATSALDSETEAAVMESIDHLHGKTTLIIIAHRLTTIRNCDEIYEVGKSNITLKDKTTLLAENGAA